MAGMSWFNTNPRMNLSMALGISFMDIDGILEDALNHTVKGFDH